MNRTIDIKRAAVIQEIGRPFVSLYVDMDTRNLYILALISSFTSPDESYIAVKASTESIEKYLEQQLSLSQLFHAKNLWHVDKENQKYHFKATTDFSPTKNMKALNLFDPDFCPDEWTLETFIEGYKENVPLELV